MIWTCKSKMDNEVRILKESAAFELDKRLWNIQPTTPADKEVSPLETRLRPNPSNIQV